MQQKIVIAALFAGSAVAVPWGPGGRWGPPQDFTESAGNGFPTNFPTGMEGFPTDMPTGMFTGRPTGMPTAVFTGAPTAAPSAVASDLPSTDDSGSDDTAMPMPTASSGSIVSVGSHNGTHSGVAKPTASGHKAKPVSDIHSNVKTVIATDMVIKTVIDTVTAATASATGANNHIAKPSFTSVETSAKAAPTSAKAAPTSAKAAPTSAKAAPTSAKSSPTTAKSSAAPSSTGTSGSTSSSGNAYQDMVINHHNVHRANHSAPDVKWDAGLAATANKIAASCKFAHDTSMDGGGYGQNIQAGASADNVWQAITESFYNGEVNAFTGYGQANPDMSTFENWGHFSQIVWASTTSVGCATVHCPNGVTDGVGTKDFTVCNYKPPGNFGGEYAKNINKSLNKPTVDKANVGSY